LTFWSAPGSTPETPKVYCTWPSCLKTNMLLCQTVTVITISYKDYSYKDHGYNDHGYNDHGYNEFMAITNKLYPKIVTIQHKPSQL